MWQERTRAIVARIERVLLPPVLHPGAMPWGSLGYLVLPFFPFVMPKFPQADLGLTLAAIVAFLPMYFAFYWVRGWRRIGVLFAMAALGIALMPANLFGNTFIVYAAVLSACLPVWRSIGVLLGTQAMSAIVMLSTPFGEMVEFVLLMNFLSSALALVGCRLWIAQAGKNQALRLSQDEIRRLAQVAERERIGRDLHDLLGHTLSVITIKAELAAKLFVRDPSAAQREIADVERIAREALGQVRGAVTGMRAVGLRAEFANARLALGSAGVDFEYTEPGLPLSAETETVLALALREATTNIIRHAGACRSHATLARDGEYVTFVVRDDGIGGARPDGNGLSGMRERIEGVGGTLVVSSASTAGTVLTVKMPYREASASVTPLVVAPATAADARDDAATSPVARCA